MTDLVRDSLREGLKAKGQSRRQSAVRRAEAANGSPQIRNDLLPALKLESYLIEIEKICLTALNWGMRVYTVICHSMAYITR
jgi:hypothetical protein